MHSPPEQRVNQFLIRAEEAATKLLDHTRRPVILIGVPGSGTSSFLAKWAATAAATNKEDKDSSRTIIIVANIGELATTLDTTPALFRFLAWELAIRSNLVEESKHFFDQSDTKIIAEFGAKFVTQTLALSAENYDTVVLCIDGVSRLRDSQRFPPNEWIPTLLRPGIGLVLTGAAVTLDKKTNDSNIGETLRDVHFFQYLVDKCYLAPRRVMLINDLDERGEGIPGRHVSTNFMADFSDSSYSCKYFF